VLSCHRGMADGRPRVNPVRPLRPEGKISQDTVKIVVVGTAGHPRAHIDLVAKLP